MITVTWGHISANHGDLAVTAGVRNILKMITNEKVKFAVFNKLEKNELGIETTDEISIDDIIVYGSGEHLFSHKNFERIIRPIINSNKGIVFPSTFGPFNELDKETFAKISKHPISARDEISATIASDVLGQEVPSLLDPAFFLPNKNSINDGFVIIVPRLENIGLRVGCNKDHDIVIKETKAYDKYCKIIKDCNNEKVLMPHTTQDNRLCHELSVETNCPVYIPNSLDDMLNMYRKCSRVISSRFHSLVFGLLFEKDIMGIPWESHGHKIQGLISMIQKNTVKNLKEKTFDWINDNMKKLLNK